MIFWQTILFTVALIGHLAIWVLLFNRLHASALYCRSIRRWEKVIFFFVLALPATYAWYLLAHGVLISESVRGGLGASLTFVYLVACGLAAGYVISVWTWRKLTTGPPAALLSNDTRIIDVAEQLGYQPAGGTRGALLAKFPGNEIFQLAVNEKVVVIPRLSKPLDGLSIVHLTDLHLTGDITQDFFSYVVDQANSLDGDLVALTGDIVEKPHCIEWLPEIVGRLRSRFGNYYVLGNHDRRLRELDQLCIQLNELGLIGLGSRWFTQQIHGEKVLLAGNERPWFGTRAELDARRPSKDEQFGLRILLSHTPDEFHWARSANFDLMLAGHTHGGQIRLPIIGAVVSPSNFGVKYASGFFYEEPTLMHVSRGISGLQPLRLNCPPELTKLVLRCGG